MADDNWDEDSIDDTTAATMDRHDRRRRRRVTTSPVGRRDDDDNNNDNNNDGGLLQDSPIASSGRQNLNRAERMAQLVAQRRRAAAAAAAALQQEEPQETDTTTVPTQPERRQNDRQQSQGRQSRRRQRTDTEDDTDDIQLMDTIDSTAVGFDDDDNNDNDDNDDDVGTNDDDNDDIDNDVDNDDDIDPDEEEDDGEDLLENMDRDYQRIEALDTYGTEGIDDTEYDPLDSNQREAAERELARLDRERGHHRSDGFYGLLHTTDLDYTEDDDARIARRGLFDQRKKSRRSGRDGGDGDDFDDNDDDDDIEKEDDQESIQTTEEDLDADDIVNLEAFDVPLREWIAQERIRREIQRRFRKFLRHYRIDSSQQQQQPLNKHNRRGNGIYEQKIRSMCAANLSTVFVSYLHIMEYEPILAYWLADAPSDMFVVLNEAMTRHTLSLFPSYNAIQNEIHVRITDVPIVDSIRDLRQIHLNCLIKVHGVITRRSAVFPQLHIAYYTCVQCKGIQGPFRIQLNQPASLSQPSACPNCDVASYRLHPTLSQYRNLQRLHLQEAPGSVPPGRVPRTKEIIVMDDLIDVVRPGEDAEITGIYEHTFDPSLTLKSGFPVFSTSITANHIGKRDDITSATNLSEQDIKQILELARDPKIGERIIESIAPSIYGHTFVKTALAMSLFAGVPKNINDKHRIRGDVNVLLLGDPGTAKSQFLKYAQNTAPRAVYSTGKGASAVGLTASVQKDPITREWTLEGGALVLADQGVCLIDEFDKMNEQDRTSIHEAMEQQTISVSKAGIVTSLQARCAVIAAANPIGGRYDSANTLSDNVELTDPILQRFDLLCVLQDTVDPVADERLATFVTNSHMYSIPTRDLPNEDTDPAILIAERHQGEIPYSTSYQKDSRNGVKLIPQQLLRKYIQYARMNVKPILRGNAFDKEKVASLYVALRRESAASGGVPIAVRHIESIVRISEAHAKMHLRDYVRDDDMNAAIKLMLQSFIDSQKFSVKRTLQRNFAKYITVSEDRAYLLLHILQDMFRKEQLYQIIRQRQQRGEDPNEEDLVLEVPLDEFESRAREKRIYDVTEFCTSEPFHEAGYIFDATNRIISRRRHHNNPNQVEQQQRNATAVPVQ